MRRLLSLLLLIGVITPAQAGGPGPEAPPDGAATLRPFKRELLAALTAGLADGAANAIDVCRLQAPALAAAAGGAGITVGRTSHKLRNPANAPRAWLEPLLAARLADPGDREPRTVSLPGGGSGYVEPIYVQPMCLACHGESLAPEVQAELGKLYPQDQATGFREGDFRGLFWVEFAPPDPR
jgi:hypothetical protein